MAVSAPWEGASADESVRRRALAAARRHSRIVRVLRVLLPVAALAALGMGFAINRFAAPDGVDLSNASLTVTPNSIIMDRPNLTGFDGEDRAYSLTADRAIQPLANPGQVRLEAIEAKVTTRGGGVTAITAESGDYDHLKNTLKLLGSIEIASAEGYTLRMIDAEVDFSGGTLATDNPVSVGYGDSTITAQRMSATDGGKLIVFDGAVRTVVMPPKRAAAVPAAEH